MPRRRLALPLLAAAALGLAACGAPIGFLPSTPGLPNPFATVPAIEDDGAAQREAGGTVRVTTELCLGALSGFEGGVTPRGDAGPECADRRGDAISLLDGDLGTNGSPITRRRSAGPTHADVAKAAFSGVSLHQILVSYRVPAGSAAPATLTGAVDEDETFTSALSDRATCVYARLRDRTAPASCSSVGSDVPRQEVEFPDAVAFRQEPTLAAGIEALDPAPAGYKWVGYVSEQVPWALTGHLTIDADFGLPVSADGKPFAGPFQHVTKLGRRAATTPDDVATQELIHDAALQLADSDVILRTKDIAPDAERGAPATVQATVADYAPGRAVDCAEELPPVELLDEIPNGSESAPATITGVPVTSTVCAQQSDVEATATTATRDFRVSGGAASAEQGQIAEVPFTIEHAGPATKLELFGVSDVPFSTAMTLAEASIGANEKRVETVRVPVPGDARPGVYDVVLRVGSGDGARQAIGRLTVIAAPRSASSVVFQTIIVERLFVGRDGSIPFGFVCPPELADACKKVVAELMVTQSTLQRATAAQARPAKMVRVGKGTFRAKPGKRVRAKVRLTPSGRKAIRRGKRMDAQLVLRVGKYKQVRKTSLRRG